MTIKDWRAEIDAIDDHLLILLNERAAVAVTVGQAKELTGGTLRDRAREREVIERAKNKNPGPLDEWAVENLFSCIIRESRRIEGCAMSPAGTNSRLSQWSYVQAPPEHPDR
ncbi:MAG: chorismate mutase [Pyrinomonadaceae bacterium]